MASDGPLRSVDAFYPRSLRPVSPPSFLSPQRPILLPFNFTCGRSKTHHLPSRRAVKIGCTRSRSQMESAHRRAQGVDGDLLRRRAQSIWELSRSVFRVLPFADLELTHSILRFLPRAETGQHRRHFGTSSRSAHWSLAVHDRRGSASWWLPYQDVCGSQGRGEERRRHRPWRVSSAWLPQNKRKLTLTARSSPILRCTQLATTDFAWSSPRHPPPEVDSVDGFRCQAQTRSLQAGSLSECAVKRR